MDGHGRRDRRQREGPDRGRAVLSPTLLRWLGEERLAGGAVLDVGTGTGALALALAPRARRVVGMDRDAGALLEAQRRARRAGLGNVLFVVGDAESADYRAVARLDLVAAHLCVSDAIVARAAAGLDPGGVLAFAAFHVDQWRETGRRSRFAYDEPGIRAVLDGSGFEVERLEIEREVTRFESAEAARDHGERLRSRWEASGRLEGWERFVAAGGRTLTESRLIVLARRRPVSREESG